MKQLVLETVAVAMRCELKNKIIFLDNEIYIKLLNGKIAKITTKKIA